jgi:hypothetical protein
MNNQESNEESTKPVEELRTSEIVHLGKKLDSVGWGLFFIWIGIAFLADFGFPAGLLGVGTITLGMQAVRLYFNLKLEGFWIIVGLLFIIGGISELVNIEIQIVPILIIIAGIVILISVVRGK